MRRYLIVGFVLTTSLAAVGAAFSGGSAKRTIGGVEAPDAIALRITQVTQVDEPAQYTKTTTKSFSGDHLVAESDTVRYHLTCLVVKEEYLDNTETMLHPPKYDGMNLETFEPVCKGNFHVGDVVTFYSLDRLVWLSVKKPNGEEFLHGRNWKPLYNGTDNNDFSTMSTEFEFAPPGFLPTAHTKWWEKAYKIDSEEAKKP